MAIKCVCRPQLRYRGQLQRPARTNPRNSTGELDLTDDDNWETVETIAFAMRHRRATEIIAVDQVEGTRFSLIETWGTSTTREAADSPHWRLVYTDMDGRMHRLNFEPGKIEDDGRWVIIPTVEKV